MIVKENKSMLSSQATRLVNVIAHVRQEVTHCGLLGRCNVSLQIEASGERPGSQNHRFPAIVMSPDDADILAMSLHSVADEMRSLDEQQ